MNVVLQSTELFGVKVMIKITPLYLGFAFDRMIVLAFQKNTLQDQLEVNNSSTLAPPLVSKLVITDQ